MDFEDHTMFFLYPWTFCWQRQRWKDIYDPECLSETVLSVFETKLDKGRSKKTIKIIGVAPNIWFSNLYPSVFYLQT